MTTAKGILHKIEVRPDIWFFFGFLITFSFNIRKVLFHFPVQGAFNEYTGGYIYLSDLFLAAAIVSWLIILLLNKYALLSSIASLFSDSKQLETCGQPLKNDLSTGSPAFFLEKPTDFKIILPLLIVPLSFLSLDWSGNGTITLYRSIRFLELFLLYIYIITSFIPYFVNSNCLSSLNCSTWNNLETDEAEIVPRGTIGSLFLKYFKAILLGLIFIMLFDHYFWDIWQGQVTLWLSCGFVAGLSILDSKSELFHVEQFGSNHATARTPTTESKLHTSENTLPFVLKTFFFIILLLGIINSAVGIVQFISQHSLGLFWLRESLISPDIPGVAKVIMNSHKIIRAYGFFPHPNILGGFLVFSIVLTMLYRKLFHVEQSSRNSFVILEKIVPRGTITTSSIILSIQIIALILTFSKSAILGLIIGLAYIIVPRGTIWKQMKQKLFHVEQLIKILAIPAAIIAIVAFTLKLDPESLFIKSLRERVFYLNVSRGTILSHPILGVGMGEFVDNFYRTIPNLSDWQYQPVHNVFLLVYNELGIIGFILFGLFILSLFITKKESKIVPRGTISE